ncbi:hypothetical protein IT575_04755 [bacterium]|nr:hypothetical protein [bacterium]
MPDVTVAAERSKTLSDLIGGQATIQLTFINRQLSPVVRQHVWYSNEDGVWKANKEDFEAEELLESIESKVIRPVGIDASFLYWVEEVALLVQGKDENGKPAVVEDWSHTRRRLAGAALHNILGIEELHEGYSDVGRPVLKP